MATSITTIEQKKDIALVTLNKSISTISNFLGSKENALRFMSSFRLCINSNPKLAECKLESLISCALECASIGIYPSNWQGDCWILPYNTKEGMMAQFQLGYKGIKTLAYRNGVKSIWSAVIFQNDQFDYTLGTNPTINHVPARSEKGVAIGAYACASFNDQVLFKIMWKDEIMAIKETSKAKDSSFSPWNKNDPELWMWQKTAFKQLAKMLPTSEPLERAIYLDNVSERGGFIKEEGVVVEEPFTEKSHFEKFQEKKTIITQDEQVS